MLLLPKSNSLFSAPTIFLVFYDMRLYKEPFSLFFGTNHFPCFYVMRLRRERLSLFPHRPFSFSDLVFYDTRLHTVHREPFSLSFSAPTISLFLCYEPAQRVILSFSVLTIFLVFYDMRLRRERLSRRERRGGGGVRSAGTLPLQSV
jgi:hypothetical protein